MKKYIIGLIALLAIFGISAVVFPVNEKAEELEAIEPLQEEPEVPEVTESTSIAETEDKTTLPAEQLGEQMQKEIRQPDMEEKPDQIPDYVMDDSVALFKDNDSGFKDVLHYMTHQKVYAATKWGAIQMTDENINKMLAILDETDYKYEEYYRNVLTYWKNGDFSNAVEVHNRIYREKDGNTGFATDLLTPEEEQKFIQGNF